jgi:hypothetical protein
MVKYGVDNKLAERRLIVTALAQTPSHSADTHKNPFVIIANVLGSTDEDVPCIVGGDIPDFYSNKNNSATYLSISFQTSDVR